MNELGESRIWRIHAIRGGCVMCHGYPVSDEIARGRLDMLENLEGHHIIAKQFLKREGLQAQLWDERNGMGLCSWHHHQHERFMQRVPRTLLPAPAFEFAYQFGIAWKLDREYPR